MRQEAASQPFFVVVVDTCSIFKETKAIKDLNERGVESFMKRCSFGPIFDLLISPVYLSVILDNTATDFGNGLDELLRDQPSLEVDAMAAVVKLLGDLCLLGHKTPYNSNIIYKKKEEKEPWELGKRRRRRRSRRILRSHVTFTML